MEMVSLVLVVFSGNIEHPILEIAHFGREKFSLRRIALPIVEYTKSRQADNFARLLLDQNWTSLVTWKIIVATR